MIPEYVDTEVLITVMTYPHPSRQSKELVCTAGILEDGSWVRLYPIDYRYMPPGQRFKKYQRIRIGLASRGAGNDRRKESRRPDLTSLKLLGEPLDTKERRPIMENLAHSTVIRLREQYEKDSTSLGIVRPVQIIDFIAEPADPLWKPEWEAVLAQIDIFSGPPKALRKIPYKFSFRFRCEDSGEAVHTAMVEDWELGVLFIKESERLGSDEAAATSVLKHYRDTICGPDRDVRFLMGTVFPYNAWVIVGIYWPPKSYQASLF